MNESKNSTRTSPIYRMVTLSMVLALSLVLSYLETFIPLPVPVPGIKLGLANMAILFVLYRSSHPIRDAAAVSLLRVLLSGLLFGNIESMAFAAGGAVLSLWGMALFRRTRPFAGSVIGVSVFGGVLHNVGQIAVACFLTEQIAIASYLPVLLVSGTLAGILVGVLAGLVILRVKKVRL